MTRRKNLLPRSSAFNKICLLPPQCILHNAFYLTLRWRLGCRSAQSQHSVQFQPGHPHLDINHCHAHRPKLAGPIAPDRLRGSSGGGTSGRVRGDRLARCADPCNSAQNAIEQVALLDCTVCIPESGFRFESCALLAYIQDVLSFSLCTVRLSGYELLRGTNQWKCSICWL